MTFVMPEFAMGSGEGFRISASDVASRHSGFSCPAGIALNVRGRVGSLRPVGPERRPKFDPTSALNFAIRDLVAAYLSRSGVGDVIDDARHTHAQRRFLIHADELAAELLPQLEAAAGVHYMSAGPIECETPIDGVRGTVTVWAHHVRTLDGLVHEAIRVRLKPIRERRDSDHDRAAVTALTLAYAADIPAVARLRISDWSVADGELQTVFDGTRADAVALYESRGRPLREALQGSDFRPGRACSGCVFVQVCPAVRQRRGALGIPGRALASRSLTASDLAAYERCPTAYAARRDHLPDAYDADAEVPSGSGPRDRGLAAHAWLAWAHTRDSGRSCDEIDLPPADSPGVDAMLAESGLDADGYALARPYLLQHVAFCTRGLEALHEWRIEPRVVMYDADADVVISISPDLTCVARDTGDLLWRETKTASALPPDTETAMQRYPGYALHVVLLIREARELGVPAHAELEVLTADGGCTFAVSTTDGALVAAAQRQVADVGRRFAADKYFHRNPSRACRSCPAHGWCDPPADLVVASSVVIDADAEFADSDDPF